jgi:hypothetical protein
MCGTRDGCSATVPVTVEAVNLRRPEIRRVVEPGFGFEDQLGLGVVPICQALAAVESDVVVVGVGHVVVVIMAEHPSAIG